MVWTMLCLTFAFAAQLPEAAPARKQSPPATVYYRTAQVAGLKIFYREAGPRDAPVILLLHGFPSSSRMFDSLFPALGRRYHLIAPDYPGFGHSDAPEANRFAYTFDHLAAVMERFLEQLGLARYTLFMQDYGGPVGFRLALLHPERVEALIIQNAVSHEVGLSPLWETRRAFWRDRQSHEATLRANFLSEESTRERHVGTDPHPESIDPDTWTDEFAFLNRPGEADIQLDLFYDYRSNVESYPRWQQYLRERQPPTLVIWGRYDPSFTVAGATAYLEQVPQAEVHLLDAGHFALDQKAPEIISLVEQFMAATTAK
ncbi:MAG: alpha/beta hydrolase [Candidatus Acidiferrum sp.]|jgi:pimeloyl-ACP methyl ester carboxylesterase